MGNFLITAFISRHILKPEWQLPIDIKKKKSNTHGNSVLVIDWSTTLYLKLTHSFNFWSLKTNTVGAKVILLKTVSASDWKDHPLHLSAASDPEDVNAILH